MPILSHSSDSVSSNSLWESDAGPVLAFPHAMVRHTVSGYFTPLRDLNLDVFFFFNCFYQQHQTLLILNRKERFLSLDFSRHRQRPSLRRRPSLRQRPSSRRRVLLQQRPSPTDSVWCLMVNKAKSWRVVFIYRRLGPRRRSCLSL